MRALTAGEIRLLEEAFQGRIDAAMVRFVDGHDDNPLPRAAFRNGNTAITLRKTIYFGAHYREDFAKADPHALGLFLHEMTHVWQYARLGLARFGLRYARDLAACRFNARAMYRYIPGETRFAEARLEAQAQMVGDYCEARLTGDEARMGRLECNLKGSGFWGL
ncbi:MAG TPA: DUF4157 domain-containing protein [Allosphingosinicella sp.]|nr:DUF4157 domain-containing protein [Allosphingosinicella sp.]